MDVMVTGRNIVVSSELRNYVEHQLTKIEKYAHKTLEVMFILKVEKYRHFADILVRIDDALLQAAGETDTIHASIDLAISKVEQQIRKYREKKTNHRASPTSQIAVDLPVDDLFNTVSHVHQIPLQTMAVSDAAGKMHSSGETSFLFIRDKTQRISLLQQKSDGTTVLIEPIVESRV